MEGSGQMAPAEAGRDMTRTAKGPLEVIPIQEVTRL